MTNFAIFTFDAQDDEKSILDKISQIHNLAVPTTDKDLRNLDLTVSQVCIGSIKPEFAETIGKNLPDKIATLIFKQTDDIAVEKTIKAFTGWQNTEKKVGKELHLLNISETAVSILLDNMPVGVTLLGFNSLEKIPKETTIKASTIRLTMMKSAQIKIILQNFSGNCIHIGNLSSDSAETIATLMPAKIKIRIGPYINQETMNTFFKHLSCQFEALSFSSFAEGSFFHVPSKFDDDHFRSSSLFLQPKSFVKLSDRYHISNLCTLIHQEIVNDKRDLDFSAQQECYALVEQNLLYLLKHIKTDRFSVSFMLAKIYFLFGKHEEAFLFIFALIETLDQEQQTRILSLLENCGYHDLSDKVLYSCIAVGTSSGPNYLNMLCKISADISARQDMHGHNFKKSKKHLLLVLQTSKKLFAQGLLLTTKENSTEEAFFNLTENLESSISLLQKSLSNSVDSKKPTYLTLCGTFKSEETDIIKLKKCVFDKETTFDDILKKNVTQVLFKKCSFSKEAALLFFKKTNSNQLKITLEDCTIPEDQEILEAISQCKASMQYYGNNSALISRCIDVKNNPENYTLQKSL